MGVKQMEILPQGLPLETKNVYLNLVSGANAEELGWQKGEVHQGTVMGNLADNNYLVLVDNKEIIVQSPFILPGGSNVAMEVQGQQDGQYLVKLFHNSTPTQEDPVNGLLNKLLIKDTPLNRNLVQGFIEQGIPLKPELLQVAERLVQRLGGDSPENINKALLSLKLGVPLEPVLVDDVYSFLTGTGDFNQSNEGQLISFMNKLVQLTDPGSENMGQSLILSREGQQSVLQLSDQLKNMMINPEQGTLKVTEQLKELIKSQLPQLMSESSATTPKDTLPAPAVTQGKELGGIFKEFSQLLQKVEEAVVEAGSPDQGQRLLQQGAAIERQIAGQQIFQALDKKDDQQNYLYFNLPFIQNGPSSSWGRLRVGKEGRSKQSINPNHFSMSLFLNTVGLGPILLNIKVRNKEVTAGGKVSAERVAGLFRDAWPKLQEAFKEMGYNLHHCLWRVGPVTENLQPQGLHKAASEFRFRSLDVTV